MEREWRRRGSRATAEETNSLPDFGVTNVWKSGVECSAAEAAQSLSMGRT
jgi:hypothetical protein